MALVFAVDGRRDRARVDGGEGRNVHEPRVTDLPRRCAWREIVPSMDRGRMRVALLPTEPVRIDERMDNGVSLYRGTSEPVSQLTARRQTIKLGSHAGTVF